MLGIALEWRASWDAFVLKKERISENEEEKFKIIEYFYRDDTLREKVEKLYPDSSITKYNYEYQ